MKKKWVGLLIVVIILIAAALYYFQRPQAVAVHAAPVMVQEVSVTTQNVPLLAQALGNVLAPDNVMLKALQAGQITAAYIKQGEQVKKGQLLLTINNVQQKANIAKDKAALVQAQSDYQRYQTLMKKQATSQSELDQYEANYFQAKATLDYHQLSLQQTNIVAPFDGIVGAPQAVRGQVDQQGNSLSNITQIAVGSYVNIGDELVQLVNLSHLQVQYDLPGDNLSLCKVGQAVLLSTQAYPGKIIHATVSYVSPSVSEQTGTFTVYATLSDTDIFLEPGLFVTVSQVLIPTREVLALPGLAVASDLSGYYVYVIEQGKLKQVNVKIGQRVGSWVEIKSGLKAGDKVIGANLDSLQPGMAVQVAS